MRQHYGVYAAIADEHERVHATDQKSPFLFIWDYANGVIECLGGVPLRFRAQGWWDSAVDLCCAIVEGTGGLVWGNEHYMDVEAVVPHNRAMRAYELIMDAQKRNDPLGARETELRLTSTLVEYGAAKLDKRLRPAGVLPEHYARVAWPDIRRHKAYGDVIASSPNPSMVDLAKVARSADIATSAKALRLVEAAPWLAGEIAEWITDNTVNESVGNLAYKLAIRL